jgi:hypothetical protein
MGPNVRVQATVGATGFAAVKEQAALGSGGPTRVVRQTNDEAARAKG